MEYLRIYHLCCRALDAPETCVHKERYLQVEEYVKRQGIPVIYPYSPEGANDRSWLVGTVCVSPPSIGIWQTAYEIYGWDMVTSTLIHEFGHCKLFEAERILEGIEAERKANEYGRNHIPPDLVPVLYEEHRKFFLKSYETPGNWTREQCLEAFRLWRTQYSSQI